MTTNSTKRDRRDWTLIIFLLPIGILLMVLAGQFAIRLVPIWSVDGGMGSSLDPETASGGQGLIPPISFDILTPMGWLDTFLTPGPDSANGDLSFPPFVYVALEACELFGLALRVQRMVFRFDNPVVDVCAPLVLSLYLRSDGYALSL